MPLPPPVRFVHRAPLRARLSVLWGSIRLLCRHHVLHGRACAVVVLRGREPEISILFGNDEELLQLLAELNRHVGEGIRFLK